MAISENARSLEAFSVNAPPRETSVPAVSPEPKKRSGSASPEPEKPPETKRSLIERLARNLYARIAIAVIIASAGGYEAYQHDLLPVHPAHQSAMSTAFNYLEGERLTQDNQTVITSLIGDNNVLDSNFETIQNSPSFNEEGTPLLYITPPKPGETIRYFLKTSTVNGIENGNPITSTNVEIDEAVGKDYNLPMPIDGSIVAYCDDQGNFLNFWVYFNDSKGIKQRLNCGAYGKSIFLQDIPKVTTKDINADKKAIAIKRGTSLLTTEESTYIFYEIPVTYGENGEITSLDSLQIAPLTVISPLGQTKLPRDTK